MAIPLTVLDSITIETPCNVPWDTMRGDDRVRFCLQCEERVHDISGMTASEALTLVTGTDHPPCVRIFRRADGRVVTADCGLTLREKTWMWLLKRSAWAASLFALLLLSGCGRQEPTCVGGKLGTAAR